MNDEELEGILKGLEEANFDLVCRIKDSDSWRMLLQNQIGPFPPNKSRRVSTWAVAAMALMLGAGYGGFSCINSYLRRPRETYIRPTTIQPTTGHESPYMRDYTPVEEQEEMNKKQKHPYIKSR